MLAKTDREIRLEEKLSKSLEIIDCFAMITQKSLGIMELKYARSLKPEIDKTVSAVEVFTIESKKILGET